MDIMVMKNPVSSMLMQQGEIVNHITSKMWVERYNTPGEFTFIAPVSSGLKEVLPIGCFVSHINTTELMIVENHEINDQQDEESKITVTGRGLDSYFEQRVVGSNRSFPRMISGGKFLLPEQKTWDQVVHLINQHLSSGYLEDDSNALAYISVYTSVNRAGVRESRKLDISDLYSAVIQLMSIDNLGIRIIRPGFWSPLGPTAQNTSILVHRGIDRSDEIIFSYDLGQLVSADYLWSNKDLKTSAVVTGQWVQTIVHLPGFTNYNRRMMQVSATDVDDDYEDENDAEIDIGVIHDKLQARGRQALKAQKDISITKAETSKKAVEARYRIHFNVGDLVSVVGDYNETAVMRVTEFVEIEDENGTVSYPTLSLEIENE